MRMTLASNVPLPSSGSTAVHVNQTLPSYFGVLDEVAKYNVQLNTAERIWAVCRLRTSPDREPLVPRC